MKQTLLFLSFFLALSVAKAQDVTPKSSILTEAETHKIFTESIKNTVGISFPIFRAYSYSDKSGDYYLVFTEKSYKKEGDNVFNDSIKAFNLKMEHGKLTTLWSLQDFKSNEAEESSIWFWTKYCELNDVDGDGLIDPIIVYGTFGINGYGDGRIKILTYYKGQKRAIRHQNGVLDFERNTQVDKDFYALPVKLTARVQEIMKKIAENNHGIFPYGYENKMAKKSLQIDERN